jgi:mannose-6-phosphate isomerase-like protein (cupin superfamily)
MTIQPDVPVSLADALASFTDEWSPRIVTTVNDYDVRVVRVHGEHLWHVHDNTDEFFLVVDGLLRIGLRDARGERAVELRPGCVFTVPRGVEHRPSAPVPTQLLLLEPSGTLTVGDRHDAVPDHVDVTAGRPLAVVESRGGAPAAT